MKTEYKKTDDPNAFVKADTSESYIYIDELTTSIEDVQQQIDSLPQPKTVPDQETLDCYNAEIEMHGEKEMLEMRLKEKQDLFDKLRSIKAVAL